jgi:ferredoxin
MKLSVDWTRCAAHGLCAALLPERISRDEWGFPLIRDGDIAERDARRIVAACPALALYPSSPSSRNGRAR